MLSDGSNRFRLQYECQPCDSIHLVVNRKRASVRVTMRRRETGRLGGEPPVNGEKRSGRFRTALNYDWLESIFEFSDSSIVVTGNKIAT
jgi:hypothetical protein